MEYDYRGGTLWIYDSSTKNYICKWDKDLVFLPTDRLVEIPLDPAAAPEWACGNELVESESLNKFLDSFKIKE